jgi:putative FmdB family regulatory protein
MPIYAYKCGSCGHAKDVLQKISDAPLTVCPACGAEAFSKQLTAPGFQLKGSGWYATDFKGGGAPRRRLRLPATAVAAPARLRAAHLLRPRCKPPYVCIAQMAVHRFAGHRARRHHRLGVELDHRHAGPDAAILPEPGSPTAAGHASRVWRAADLADPAAVGGMCQQFHRPQAGGLGRCAGARIPVVRSIYSSVKQVSDTLFSDSGNAFRTAVLVQWPREGVWTVAFVTGQPSGEVAATCAMNM